jgi:hypothetical protein
MYQLIVAMTLCVACSCAFHTSVTPTSPQLSDKRIEELVRTVNDNPDPLHFHSTPSVSELIDLGKPVIPRMLDLMLSEDEATRSHAMHVLSAVTMPMFGYVQGRGWPEHDDNDRWNAFWKSLGDLDADQPRKERERAVRLWREWLARNNS